MVEAEKPDFKNGFSIRDLADGAMALGRVDGEDVVLARFGDEFFAVGANCTHYHGMLSGGLVVGDTPRCPLHHACFSLRSGEVLSAPALDSIPHWRVEKVGDKVFVREKLPDAGRKQLSSPVRGEKPPASVVIIGGGAAGLGAADMLRREGYDGPLTMISADDSPPYDRPNLSKDFLVGAAPDEWMRPSFLPKPSDCDGSGEPVITECSDLSFASRRQYVDSPSQACHSVQAHARRSRSASAPRIRLRQYQGV